MKVTVSVSVNFRQLALIRKFNLEISCKMQILNYNKNKR